MKKITVVATGNPVPYEGDASRTIGDSPVEVSRTPYYARRIAHGELREATAPSLPAAPDAAGGKVK